jgi:hypothetical protein
MYRRTTNTFEAAAVVNRGPEGAKEALSYIVAKDPFVSAAACGLLNLSSSGSLALRHPIMCVCDNCDCTVVLMMQGDARADAAAVRLPRAEASRGGQIASRSDDRPRLRLGRRDDAHRRRHVEPPARRGLQRATCRHGGRFVRDVSCDRTN